MQKASVQLAMSSVCHFGFLGLEVRTTQPLKISWGFGYIRETLLDNSSLKSTYLPVTIWLTNFVGVRENTRLTASGWWKTGQDSTTSANEQ